MRVHHNVCCGMDVHKKSVTACLMWGPADKEPEFEIRRFGTMTRDLQKLAEWLKQAGCEAATMESTGSYWEAPYGMYWRGRSRNSFWRTLNTCGHYLARRQTERTASVWLN